MESSSVALSHTLQSVRVYGFWNNCNSNLQNPHLFKSRKPLTEDRQSLQRLNVDYALA